MLLGDFYANIYRPRRLLGRSWMTDEQYRNAIRRFAAHLGRAPKLSDLVDEVVVSMAVWMLDMGRAPATVNCVFAHLRAMWRFAHRLGHVDRRPQFENVPTYRKNPRAWSVREIGMLLSAAAQATGMVGPIAADRFWQALVLFFYDVGCRKRVAMRMPYENVDLPSRLATLPAEEGKPRKDELHLFSRQTARALRAIIKPEREPFFPWPYDQGPRTRFETLNEHFRAIVYRAGLDDKHGLFQRLRRTRATYGEIVAPGSATRDLGHSARWLTERHYIDQSLLPPSDVVDKLPRPRAS